MKAVDFIVELDKQILFIEFKDPDNLRAKAKPKNRDKFLNQFISGEIDNDLKTKYRDTWLYEFAEGRAAKPIFFLVLIAAESLSDAELSARTEALKRQIPITGPSGRPWQKPFITGCAVMNLAAWNRIFNHIPASRVGI